MPSFPWHQPAPDPEGLQRGPGHPEDVLRELHPGKRNNLDALCDRYQINNAHRTLHGALLDAELLAEAYLAMTRGQESLIMEQPAAAAPTQQIDLEAIIQKERPPLVVRRAEGEDLAAHTQVLAGIQKDSKAPAICCRH